MNKKSDRPILVYRFSSLGDIAMTVPVLRSFFNSYPNQKIIFVSRPNASPLFEEFDNIEFIPIDLKRVLLDTRDCSNQLGSQFLEKHQSIYSEPESRV